MNVLWRWSVSFRDGSSVATCENTTNVSRLSDERLLILADGKIVSILDIIVNENEIKFILAERWLDGDITIQSVAIGKKDINSDIIDSVSELLQLNDYISETVAENINKIINSMLPSTTLSFNDDIRQMMPYGHLVSEVESRFMSSLYGGSSNQSSVSVDELTKGIGLQRGVFAAEITKYSYAFKSFIQDGRGMGRVDVEIPHRRLRPPGINESNSTPYFSDGRYCLGYLVLPIYENHWKTYTVSGVSGASITENQTNQTIGEAGIVGVAYDFGSAQRISTSGGSSENKWEYVWPTAVNSIDSESISIMMIIKNEGTSPVRMVSTDTTKSLYPDTPWIESGEVYVFEHTTPFVDGVTIPMHTYRLQAQSSGDSTSVLVARVQLTNVRAGNGDALKLPYTLDGVSVHSPITLWADPDSSNNRMLLRENMFTAILDGYYTRQPYSGEGIYPLLATFGHWLFLVPEDEHYVQIVGKDNSFAVRIGNNGEFTPMDNSEFTLNPGDMFRLVVTVNKDKTMRLFCNGHHLLTLSVDVREERFERMVVNGPIRVEDASTDIGPWVDYFFNATISSRYLEPTEAIDLSRYIELEKDLRGVN